jgi:dipeptidyl aminopeptidase/acylaminoacyl peptidase
MSLVRAVSAALILCSWGIADVTADAPSVRRFLGPEDFFRIQTVSEPQVSPDGQWIAYVLTSNDREADEARSAIWMVNWRGDQQIQLTNAVRGAHAPRWSPDGRYLAFIAATAGSENAQIMLLDRRGGEARQLTRVAEPIGDYFWSPDGLRLAVVMEQNGAASNRLKPIVIDSMHFKQDEDGYLGAGYGRHIYLLDVALGTMEALIREPGFNDDLPAWSPDGRQIAFVRTHEVGPDLDGREDIDVIDARPGATAVKVVRPYAPNRQKLEWSPDGASIAYLQGLEPKYNQYIQDRLGVVSLSAGIPRTLANAPDRAVMAYRFSRHSASIIATLADDGSVYPANIDLRNGTTTAIASGRFVVSALSESAGHMVVLYTDDGAPAEVYALEEGALRKITRHNDTLLAQVTLGTVEELRFASRDGTRVHGFTVKPPGYVAGRRYPTVLWIHGGPNAQDAHALTIGGDQFQRQLLAASGFVVLGINYRGSSGRGQAFANSIAADWGQKEVEDLLAGIDYVVAAGLADPQRLGIGGWSYGGILTDYVIAADRRMKAAVSGAGSANMLSMYGHDEYIMQYNNELGPPWRNPARWISLSYPFLHADKIHTPTLFLGGDRDFDVPIVGGEQMYQALRTLGIPAQLIVYPGQFHSLTRPSFLKDRAERIVAWYVQYLRPGQ